MRYSAETLPVKWIGTIRRHDGTTLKVFGTAQGKSVLMFPLDSMGKLRGIFTSVKITDLRRAMRLRLCC
jgi:hypothetical protein